MTINLKNKQELIKKFGKNSKDSGSVEVQVAMLSQKISELTEHLKINAKDFQASTSNPCVCCCIFKLPRAEFT